jgi:predicted ATPase
MLDIILFSPVTVFYGSNGSGKSTLLNVIAEKISLPHRTKGNSTIYYTGDFIGRCAFEMATRNGRQMKIPPDSRFIRSEDVMEAIVQLRHETKKAEDNIFELQSIDGMDSGTINAAIGAYHELPEQYSNGETSMAFFENIFQPDTLYLLDEPDNSLSPVLQLSLKKLIEEYTHLFNCQFIIATHSPFLLAVENGSVYDLDRSPSTIRKWYELDNVQVFYQFFKTNKHLFT